jgi:hypothetical protein
MADQLSLRGGTTTEHGSFTGANKEVTVDTTKKTLVVHDGATVGGHPIMRENGTNSALALGSAATPSLKFTGDTNTGIYSPGADQVAISTNGVQRLLVNGSGNISLGTLGAAAGISNLRGSSFHQFVAESSLFIDLTPSTGQIIFRRNAGASESMRIDGSGRLGLGTSSPDQLLHVRGASDSGFIGPRIQNSNGLAGLAGVEFSSDPTYAKAAIAHVRDGLNGRGALVFYNDSNNDAANWATGDEKMRITNAGNVGIGTTAPLGKTHIQSASTGLAAVNVAGDELVIENSGTAGMTILSGNASGGNIYFADADNAQPGAISYDHSDNSLAFRVNASERARIDSSGRLLVGTTTSPSVECLLNSVNYRALRAGTAGGYSERVRTGSLTAGASFDIFRVLNPDTSFSNRHNVLCRLTVTVDGRTGGNSRGYAGATSIREFLFSSNDGSAGLRYNTEVRNFAGSANADVLAVSLVTAGATSGSDPDPKILTVSATATYSGSNQGTEGEYVARIEVFSITPNIFIEAA